MNNLRIFILFLMSIALVGCGFAEAGNNYDIPGFFSGIWHGLLALWSFPFKVVFRYRNVCFAKL
jgi:hypothetical protein